MPNMMGVVLFSDLIEAALMVCNIDAHLSIYTVGLGPCVD